MSSEILQVIQEQNSLRHAKDNDAEMAKSEAESQYLSFEVGNEIFAVSILKVQEIRAWELPTFLPNSPDYISGVLNLRGTIVPVMDLRKRFKFGSHLYDATTVIIILKSKSANKDRLMGCVVDGVSDVFSYEASDISDAPDYASNLDARFIVGIMSVHKQAVTLLNLNNLLNLEMIEHPFSGDKLRHG